VAQKLNLDSGAIFSIFQSLIRQRIPDDRLVETFADIAATVSGILQSSGSIKPENSGVGALLVRADAFIASNSYNEATQALAAAAKMQDVADKATLQELEKNYLDHAAIYARAGEVNLARLQFREASDDFKMAIEKVPSSRADIRGKYRVRYADALFEIGDRHADNDSLQKSVEAYNLAANDLPRDRSPQEWASVQNAIANSSYVLALRERGTDRLSSAISSYRLALASPSGGDPVKWATIQANLGKALLRLSWRSGGLSSLNDAFVAFHAALEVFRQDLHPLEWAEVQHELGNALQSHNDGDHAVKRIELAIASYDRALIERTQTRTPRQWADTLTNRSIAQTNLGERIQSIAVLEDAIRNFELTLGVRTRASLPLSWANTQCNLSKAVAALGSRKNDSTLSDRAAKIASSGLREATVDRDFRLWLVCQNNLARALTNLGLQKKSISDFNHAVTEYRIIFERLRNESSTYPWIYALAQEGYGDALVGMANIVGHLSYPKEVREAYEMALRIWQQQDVSDMAERVTAKLNSLPSN
jgi:hypothetical protein